MRTPVLLGSRHVVDVVRPLHPIASVYIGPPNGVPWTDRLAGLVDVLRRDGADDATIADLAVAVHDEPAGAVAVFADGGHVPAAFDTPGLRGPDSARFAAPARVLPLLAWAQQRPPYVVVRARRGGVEVSAVPGGLGGDVPGPVRCRSQAAAGAIRAVLAGAAARLLVVHGNDRLLGALRGAFAYEATVRRVRESTADRLADVTRSTSRLWTEQSLATFDEWSATPGRAVQGVPATLDALAAGRARELLVEDPPSGGATAWFGAAPAQVLPGGRETPRAGRTGAAADVAVRSALLSGIDVRVLRKGTPGAPAGGIGALCRFPLAAVPS